MKKTNVLFFCIVTVFCLALAPPAIGASEEDAVLQVAMDWAKAFSSADFERMSSLYLHSPETSEFGPVIGQPFLYRGWNLLEEQWKSNTAIPAGALTFSIHNPHVALIGKDAAVTAVYQIAVYTDPDTNEQSVGQIRQTLVVQKVRGKWLIVHHHSSHLPVD